MFLDFFLYFEPSEIEEVCIYIAARFINIICLSMLVK